MTNVKTVQVEKPRLILTLQENMAKHQREYREAVVGYNQEMVVLLRRLKDDVSKSLAIWERPSRDLPTTATVNLEEIHEVQSEITSLELPRDHSDSYQQAIALMDWETRDTIELSINDFECYVRDNWNWMTSFKNSVANYSSSSRH